MGSTGGQRQPAWLLKVVFLVATCFAAGLVTAGVVSGAGPLAALSTDTETTSSETTDTTTTDPEPGEPETTETTETMEPVESEPTDTTTSTSTSTTEPNLPDEPTTQSVIAEKDDYVPGEIVTLWGSGWAPDETVEILVNDDEGKSWSHTGTAAADALGAFMYEFRLPDWFVATYYVTATSASGVTVNSTFDDSVAVGGSSTNNNGGSGAASREITISAPAVASGDVLVAQIVITDSITTTAICAPVGWTSVLNNSRDDKLRQHTFWLRAAAAAGATSYTWTFRNTTCGGALISPNTKGASGGVIRYTGVIAAGNPVDVSAGNAGSSSGPFQAPAVTPSVANTKIIRYFGVFKNTDVTGSNRIYHVSSSTTKERAAAAFDGGTHATAGTSTGTFTATLASSAEFASQTLALKPAPVAVSDAPTVSSPICAGATSVSGFSSEANGTTIEVFKTGVSVGTTTVTGGAWTKTGLSALVAGDLITARASATGESASPDSNTVTVTTCNTAPVANDDAHSVNEDNPLNVAAPGVLGNDTDANGNALTAVLDAGPTNAASFTLNANGSFDYTPNANFNGADTFTYRANDGTANGNIATVAITVNPVNDQPTANSQSVTVAEDSADNSITLTGGAGPANESGQTLTFQLTSLPDNGSLSETAGGPALSGATPITLGDGLIFFTPDADYCTTDNEFDFRVTDSGGTADGGVDTSANATVSVTVTCANDAPNAVNDSATVDEDSSATAIDVLDNDTDPDGDTLTVTDVTNPPNGSAVNNSTDVSYTPGPDFCGTDTFDYTISDGEGGSDTATVTVTVTCVNDEPDAVDDSATVAEDSGATAIDVVGNDTDTDADTLTVTAVTDPDDGTAANGTSDVSYTPDADFCGTDTFDYTISDGEGGSDTATVTVTVTCVNDEPDAVDDSATVDEDSSANTIDVLDNDTDAENDTLTVTAVTDPADGATLNNTTDVSYTPDADFCGTDTFDYTISDGEGGSDTATVTVTVTCVNDEPVAVDDDYDATEDTQLVVAIPGVLGNDTDVEDDSLTAALVDDVDEGTLALAVDGSFTYDPDDDFCGSDSFTYEANDGDDDSNVATVSIDVACVNDAPVAVDDSYNATEDVQLVATAPGVLGNDTDVDDVVLNAVLVSDVGDGTLALAADGSFTYDPDADFCGSDSFTYQANDGEDDSNVATVSIPVACVNDAPVAVDDEYDATEDTQLVVAAPGVLGNDTDVEDDSLTAVLVDDVAHGTLVLAADGSFTYDPTLNYCGTDSFTYKANDGTDDSNIATVSLEVECVNDPPVANADLATVVEDSGANAIDVLANDTDVDNATLSVASVTQPADGSATDNGTDVTYTPDDDFCGTDTFDYTVSDGNGGTDTATVSITVTCVNDVPVAAAGGPYTGDEGATVELDGSGSTDVEGAVAYSWTVTPQTGGANDPGTGASCAFVDGTTSSSQKPKVSCTDDGIYDIALTVTDTDAATDGDSTTLTLANVAPTVAKPTFQPSLIACQTSTTLTGISFGDPGTVDNPWTVDIDWGDGGPHTSYTTATQGAQPPQSHTYATAGPHTATVSVADKDGDSGSNTSTAAVSVFQYTVDFLPPFDDSTPSGLIVNKMKNGRVVPVKARIRDHCAGADLTDPAAVVTIKVTKTTGTGTGDPVEEYADAGQSSAGTNEFRPAGGFWVYNLDSKALGLIVNNLYRVDVYVNVNVNAVKATVTNWAVLQPVK